MMKYHDGQGNLAEVEDETNGKQFVRLIKPGISKMEVHLVGVIHGKQVYHIENEGEREPDLAYDCFQGFPAEVDNFLINKGFKKAKENQA